MNELLEKSIEITKDYLINILFVDDKVTYSDASTADRHILYADSLTKSFASNKMNSIFFKYNKPNEKGLIQSMFELSDVCVLDWQLVLPEDENQDLTDDEGKEDVEEPEGRGRYAMELLREFVASNQNTPKLIIIYSAEVGGEIPEALKGLEGGNYQDYSWISDNKNVQIVVYYKPSLTGSHTEDSIKTRIISYDGLPEIIINEFAHLHCGLLSNAILKSIAVIRKNTNRLLELYNNKYDSAFVTHRAMCPYPDDAGELLKETISDSFNAVLSYEDIQKTVSIDAVEAWLKDNSFKSCKTKINKKSLVINDENRGIWQKIGYLSFIKQIYKTCHGNANFPEEITFTSYTQRPEFRLTAISSFIPDNIDVKGIHEKFAILSQHKSNLISPDHHPVLSIGTVIKNMAESDDAGFYLCIQQKCDSIRIVGDDERNFLFLPLGIRNENQSFDIVYESYEKYFIRLAIIKKASYNLQIFPFKATDGFDYVTAEKNDFNKFIFTSTDKSEFEWLLDMKESHAQKIINEFAATMSRVGIDQSEWLRRS